MNFNNIHPFKREFVESLYKSDTLNKYCNELWVFGSTVKGASNKQHTFRSDVDLLLFTGYPDIMHEVNGFVDFEIHHIMDESNIKNVDIIWGDHLDEDSYLIKEAKDKGVRLI